MTAIKINDKNLNMHATSLNTKTRRQNKLQSNNKPTSLKR